MKLNGFEKALMNNPVRALVQNSSPASLSASVGARQLDINLKQIGSVRNFV